MGATAFKTRKTKHKSHGIMDRRTEQSKQSDRYKDKKKTRKTKHKSHIVMDRRTENRAKQTIR